MTEVMAKRPLRTTWSLVAVVTPDANVAVVSASLNHPSLKTTDERNVDDFKNVDSNVKSQYGRATDGFTLCRAFSNINE
jgi:hypothetical protein